MAPILDRKWVIEWTVLSCLDEYVTYTGSKWDKRVTKNSFLMKQAFIFIESNGSDYEMITICAANINCDVTI
jgi:hypothetical protein